MSAKAQGKSAEANFWDKVADERIYAAFSEKEYNRIFDRHLGPGSNARALDIGCASGVSAVILARRGMKVKGIDISSQLIEQARRLWKDEENPVIFSVGDAENLDCAGSSIDLCFLGGVIHHFPDTQRLFQELSRILRKGGRLLMIEPNYFDIVERISWFFAGKLNLLSPNEFPVSPLEIKAGLEQEFESFEIYPIRTDDIPFFTFIPLIGRPFFRGGRGKVVKKIFLALLNIFRPDRLSRGNFFVLSCVRK